MAKCEYPDCEKEGDTLVFSRKQDKVVKVCEGHSEMIIEEGHPEYIADCPNCGCMIPVN